MQKVKISLQSWLLVSVQFGALLYIFTSASYTAHSILGLLVQLGGIFIGFWAVLSIGVLNFSVFPEPKDKIKLITTGCYHYIRHPMYAAVLLLIVPLVIDYFTYWRLLALSALFTVGYLKIMHEETALTKLFPEYREYCQNTNRIIPYLW